MNGGSRLAAPRQAVRRALAWWWGELASLAPATSRVAEAPSAHAIVRATPEATVIELDGDARARLKSLDGLDDTEAGQLRELAASHRVSIALGEHDTHQLTLSLPRAARRHLDQAIGFHLGVASAVKTDDVTYVAVPRPRVAGADSLEVNVLLAKRRRLEAITSAWERHGLPPVAVGVAPPGATALTSVLIEAGVPVGARPPSGALLGGLLVVLLAAAPLAVSAVLSIADTRVRAATARLEQDLRPRLSAQADAAAAARLHALVAEPLRAPRVAELVAHLAQALPPTAWVERLVWHGGRAEIIVRGADAAELQPLLSRRARFGNARAVDEAGGVRVTIGGGPSR